MRLQSEQSCNFEEFTDLIHKLLNSAWGEDWGKFTESFPSGTDPRNVELPVITYSIVNKTPGLVGKTTREIKARHRLHYIDPNAIDDSVQSVSVYGQVFDHEVRFDVWEENNTRTSEVGDRFEDFMMVYAGYLKQRGVREIIFKGMTSTPWIDRTDSASCRQYTYLVTLEKQVVVPTHVIKEVIARVEVVSGNQDQNIEAIDFKINKGGNS